MPSDQDEIAEPANTSPSPELPVLPRKSRKSPIVIGAILIVLGIALNPITVARQLGRPALKADAQVLLIVLELAFIASGALLIRFRRNIRWRYLVFASIPLLLLLMFAEVAARAYFRYRTSGMIERFALTGWRPVPNKRFQRNAPGFGPVDFTTTREGFRRWPDRLTTGPRVLVIGDSFTHAHTVSDNQAFFDKLAAAFPSANFFAFGCAGYGTLQEYMILDRYADEIKPDLLIWQFCQNDIINNDYQLESLSAAQNNHILRPYYEAGEIVWLYPKQRENPVYWLGRYSYLLRLIDEKRDLSPRLSRWTVENDLTDTHPLQMRSAETTKELMRLVRKRVGAIRILAFSDNKAAWAGTAYERACQSNNIDFIDEIGANLERRVRAKEPILGTNEDYHWNPRGHKIVADALRVHLARTGTLNNSALLAVD